ncbi:RNA-dependent RNA polymerase family protein [Inconstantimicrobium porci]|uniref:Reverse transcriptase domain-containing protein n=1 Tax=Inconstantimicrobium porci TaxID=2652291 RepID=A0A7X2N0P3_9CLOT|nr:hypothetical protein [Inconstantimicrobium porci]MSR92601.1 hypothetical protein [Inconstantimicrobium porci]
MKFELPENLRGIKITSISKVINRPKLMNTLSYLKKISWDKNKISTYYKKTFNAYSLDNILDKLMNEKTKIKLIKDNILNLYKEDIGINCLCIYIVAFFMNQKQASNYKEYAECASKYFSEDTIKNIWSIGIADGTYLNLIDSNGKILDYDFFYKWVYIDGCDSVFKYIIQQYEDDEMNKNKYLLFHKIKTGDVELSNKNIKREVRKKPKKVNQKSVQNSKKIKQEYREVYVVAKKSIAEVCLKYLKKRLDKEFNISYPNRFQIMNECISVTENLRYMSNFVIFKYDFKDFFNSVSSQRIFNDYIINSSMKKNEIALLEKLVHNFEKCYAGLATSNSLIEIKAKDFDMRLQIHLRDYGMIFYKRYVDDGLIIFNKFVSEDTIKSILYKTVSEIFGQEVKINENKCIYINQSNSINSFNYLGYEFIINKNNKYKIQYGITSEKRKRFENKITAIVNKFKKDENMELFRTRLQFILSRVVFFNCSRYRKEIKWQVIGVSGNYMELRRFIDIEDKITTDTLTFLKDSVYDIIEHELGTNNIPYFLKKSKEKYSLYFYMKNNKSIVFHPNIGWSQDYLSKRLKKINLNKAYNLKGKSYREIVSIFCDKLKLKE